MWSMIQQLNLCCRRTSYPQWRIPRSQTFQERTMEQEPHHAVKGKLLGERIYVLRIKDMF